LPLYASPEQLMRDRSEYARKGISRGRSVVALKYADGLLFVAENPSTTLHKVSEIYARIGFAAAGRYSEYESLRRAGIRHVDLQGYSYDPRDVSARQLANVYAQTLGAIVTEQVKPFAVELARTGTGRTTPFPTSDATSSRFSSHCQYRERRRRYLLRVTGLRFGSMAWRSSAKTSAERRVGKDWR
jgi:proteasome alpha subunit